MTRYRARANGNLYDVVPESLVGVLFDPVEDEPAVDAAPREEPEPTDEPAEEDGAEEIDFEPAERPETSLATPEAPLETVAHTDAPKPRPRRPRGKKGR